MIAVRLAALVLMALAACAPETQEPPPGLASAATPPRRGGTLRLADARDVPTLDPALGYDDLSWFLEDMLFNTLVDYGDGTEITGELAAHHVVGDGGRRYTFALRPGVRFPSGRGLEAEDVRASIERVLAPAARSQGAEFFAGLVGAADFAAGRATHVAGIEITAADGIAFRLEAPDPLFLHKLAMPFAAVVDRFAAAAAGPDFARRPVGTGAFVLREWTEGQRLVLERNPHYFREGLPYLERLELRTGVVDQLAWLIYRSGDLDVVRQIPAADFPAVAANPRFAPLILRRTTMRTTYVGVNCEIEPLTDVRVRRALNYAVSKQRIVDLLNGRAQVARGVLPPAMPGARGAEMPYPYDPDRARALLREAGRDDGFAATLWTRLDDESLRVAQSVQQDLRHIGVRLRVRPVDWPALIEAVRHRGMVSTFVLGWEADFPDPGNFLEVLLHGRNHAANNHTFFADPDVDRLLDAAAAQPPGPERHRRYAEIEDRVVAAAPWIFLYHPIEYVARNPRVQGLRLHPLRPARLETVWLTAGADGAGGVVAPGAPRP